MKTKSVKKMLNRPFIIFTNEHPELGSNVDLHDVMLDLKEAGFKRIKELIGVNSFGAPRKFLLVSLDSSTVDQRIDLLEYVVSALEQRFVTMGHGGHDYCLYNLEENNAIAFSDDLQVHGDIPRTNYYLSQDDGYCFTINFTKGE